MEEGRSNLIITLTRSGGFSGVPRKKIINTKKLPPETAKKIEGLIEVVKRSTFEKSPIKLHPDQFQYTISLKDSAFPQSQAPSGTWQTITIDESSLNPEMQELLQLLQNDF